MILFSVLLISIASFFAGFYFRRTLDRVKVLEEKVIQKMDKPQAEPESLLVDPTDQVQNARYEMEQRMKEIN